MNSTNVQKIKSGAKWEPQVAYSRAVKAGNMVFVSGTAAVDENGNAVAKGDMYGQTRQCILNIERALKEAGAALENVVRTRTYITNMDEWEAFGRAHKEFFEGIEPAATLVEVTRLINPDLLIEMEADAIVL